MNPVLSNVFMANAPVQQAQTWSKHAEKRNLQQNCLYICHISSTLKTMCINSLGVCIHKQIMIYCVFFVVV